MEIVAVVIALALLEFVVFGMLVGRARGRYGVNAPAISGHEIFDRYFRVHYNTMEMLVTFGAVYLVGRIVYLRSYVADPRKRDIGFGLSALPIVVLLLGALWGAVRVML
jgi:glutathione S-transferase